MLPPLSLHPPQKLKNNNNNEQTRKINKKINKQANKKNKPSTVVPEIVTLDCSLTHVIQVPKTQPYPSYSWLTGVICEVINPQRPDQDWQAPLQCFSWKLGPCRGVDSWRLNEQTESLYIDWGNICEVIKPKDNVTLKKASLH